jgi:hypothetical protein
MNGRAGRRRGGHSIVEVMVALAVFAIAIGAAALVGLRSEATFRTESWRMTLDTRAREVLTRLAAELRSSAGGSVTALAESPTWDDALTFDSVASIDKASGKIEWSTSRIEFRYEAGEIDNGLDDNGNGLIDEGIVVLIRDWGGPGQLDTVLTRWVPEYLEGETFNGLDDNGNGLIDERGFAVARQGETITLLLTLERVDGDGRLATRTGETSILLRN